MRLKEILEEDYNQNLESDLNNLLIAAKGAGKQEIKTQDLVDRLVAMGYTVNVNSLMPLLSANPTVLNATPSMIGLSGPEGTSAGPRSSGQDSAAKVADLASKATKIG